MTRAAKTQVSSEASGCHCTPRRNRAEGASIASSTPSAEYAVPTYPGAVATDWWCEHRTAAAPPMIRATLDPCVLVTWVCP